MNEIIQAIKNRKSVRVFNDDEISKDACDIILDAAMQAPSAGNQQQYTILKISDQELKEKLADVCDHQSMIAKAPLVLVFVADPRRWYDAYCKCHFNVRKPKASDLLLGFADGCIAAQNAVMAAESLGIGSCYIGDILENSEQVQILLHLPNYVMPCVMVIFGYPTKQQQERVKPARFDIPYIVQDNYYENRNYHQEAFLKRAGKEDKKIDYNEYLKAFALRKYESAFSREMARSVDVYLKQFDDRRNDD